MQIPSNAVQIVGLIVLAIVAVFLFQQIVLPLIQAIS